MEINDAKEITVLDFIRFLLWENSSARDLTWIAFHDQWQRHEVKRGGKGQTRMPENAGESCTSRNIEIRAGKSVFSSRAGREGEEAAQVSSRASGVAAFTDLLVLLQRANASGWVTAAVFF